MNFRKTAINLSGRGLTEFPKEIFLTSRVYKLNLSRNKIAAIPKEIAQLKHLEMLDLSGNLIRHLYAKLFDLPKLKILILNNNLVINIPKQIEKLCQLKILNLSNNKIALLPIELMRLKKLEELNLTGNLLNDLPIHGDLPFDNLKVLWIAQNPLRNLTTGKLLNSMPRLKSVYCYSPKIESPIVCKDEGILAGAAVKGNCLSLLKELSPTNDSIEKISKRNSGSVLTLERSSIMEALVDVPRRKVKMKKDPTKIFISYSHEDSEYLIRLKRHLKVMSYDFDFDAWDDTRIKSSEEWRDAIEKALQECAVAILLVSTDFLGSDFIRKDELPPLLKAAEEKGTRIFPVIIHPCMFLQTKSLSQFQAVNSPDEALSECPQPKQERIWMKLCNDIKYFFEN